MRLKVAFCLVLLALPTLIGCSSQPKEEPTPQPPAAAAPGAAPGAAGAPQPGAKGVSPQ